MKLPCSCIPLLVFLAMLLCAPEAEAQSTGSVTGTVVDTGTGEPLDGVEVFITILGSQKLF